MAFLSLWGITPFLFFIIFILDASKSSSLTISDEKHGRKERAVDAEPGLTNLQTYLKQIYPTIPKPIKPVGELPPFRAPSITNFAVINQYLNNVIPAYFKASQTCSDLNVYVGILMNRIRIENGSEKDVEELLMNMCVIRQKPQIVCSGLIKRFVPTFYYIVKRRLFLTPEVFVGTVFQQLGCRTNSTYVEWSVNDPFVGIDSNETLIEDSTDENDESTTESSIILVEDSTTISSDQSASSTTLSEEDLALPPPSGPIIRDISKVSTTTKKSRQPRDDSRKVTRTTTTTVALKPNPDDVSTKKPRRTTTEQPTSEFGSSTIGQESTSRNPPRTKRPKVTTTILIDESTETTITISNPETTTIKQEGKPTPMPDSSTTRRRRTKTTMDPNETILNERTTRRRRTTVDPTATTLFNVNVTQMFNMTTRRRRTTTSIPSEIDPVNNTFPDRTTRRRRTTTLVPDSIDDTTLGIDKTTKRRRTTTTVEPSLTSDLVNEIPTDTSERTTTTVDPFATTLENGKPTPIPESTTSRRRTTTGFPVDGEVNEVSDKTTRRRRITTTEGFDTILDLDATFSPEDTTILVQDEPYFPSDTDRTTRRRRTTTTQSDGLVEVENGEITERTTRRRRTTLMPEIVTSLPENPVQTEGTIATTTTKIPETTTQELKTTTTTTKIVTTTTTPKTTTTTPKTTTTTPKTTTTTITTTPRQTTTIKTTTPQVTPTTEATTTPPTTKETTSTTTTLKTSTTSDSTTTFVESTTSPVPPPHFEEPAFEAPRLLKILHMTDLHVDPLYMPDTNAACENKVLCCHEDSGKAPNRSVNAGIYGSNLYCDTPMATLESALKSVRNLTGDIDVFYMSGDLVPHNLWYTNKPENIKTIEQVSGMIRTYFPTTQIIPVMGNHEPHPVDLFSPKNLSIPSHLATRWMLAATHRSWLGWIPRESADEYKEFGHYAIQLDGYRVLVLNTNLCFGVNLWQLYNFNEFKEQLQWLQRQLQSASESNQMVHIVGHLPPGYSGCSKVFSRNYYTLISNYSRIIGGQFFGHLHVDTFRLYFNPKRRIDPINVQWITPSFTPYKSNNPAYKIYYVDPQTLQVIDHETYILDLEKANAQPKLEPLWYRLYGASEHYEVTNVTLSNLAFIVDRLAANPHVFETYYQYYLKAADYLQSKPCDTYCRKKILCRIVRPFFGADEECDRVQLKVDGGVVPVYDEYPLF